MSSLSIAQIGDALRPLTFGPISRATLALYAGASGDHNPIHIDSDMAKAAGMPDVFAQGMLSAGVLARLITEWVGPDCLLSITARFIAMTHVHDVVTCTGDIIEFLERNGERCARVAIQASIGNGRPTIEGEALVVLRA